MKKGTARPSGKTKPPAGKLHRGGVRRWSHTDLMVESPEESAGQAQAFAAALQPGDTVAFYGSLGSGKTFWVKNICARLKSEPPASSPTFTIMNEYQTPDGQVLCHFDFYRLEKEVEIAELGLEDFFYNSFICLIEWPEKIAGYLPTPRYEVYLEFVAGRPLARSIRVRRVEGQSFPLTPGM